MIKQRIEALQELMKAHGLDVVMIPSGDPHLSEYVPDHYMARTFFSGFTGSAGTLLVTLEGAELFTDGRYFVQAAKELEGSGITLMKMGEVGVPTLLERLDSLLGTAGVLGMDGRVLPYTQYEAMKATFSDEVRINLVMDPAVALWENRPSRPNEPIFHHEIAYTGRKIEEKLEAIREKMRKKKVNAYTLASLNDLAWLFNYRGHDIAYTPVAYAYAYITLEKAYLFIDDQKITDEHRKILEDQGVVILDYTSYYAFLGKQKDQKIYMDGSKVNALMVEGIEAENSLTFGDDLVFFEKGCLSATEIENLRNAQIRDGVAMVNFLYWLDTHENVKALSEVEVAHTLTKFRADQPRFLEPSFNTIPAYGPNGAMMHYAPTDENHSMLDTKSFFLIDSGGQYYDGTTDITRTIPMGSLTEEEMTDYTLVLLGHINLAKMIFLEGITGTNLDTIARQPIWARYMDYKSGTGHGVGYVLGVHEGPGRIRKEQGTVVLKPGMILTNEPGIYKEGKYGIRIENTLLVQEAAHNDMGLFYNFDVISYCPIDLRPVKKDLLGQEATQWLNAYHRKVYETLSPYLGDQEKSWLANAAREI